MAADCIRVRTLGHSYNVVVFMAAQPSEDGRLGGPPQNSYAGRHPSKRFVQGERRIPSVSNLILPKVGELMVSNQQYDSHEERFRQVSLECFIVDRSTPCLRGVGAKALSGKEDTTLLSMADCRVKQATISTATRYGIKPRIQGRPRGSVRIGGQNIRFYKKKKKKKYTGPFGYSNKRHLG